MSHLLRRPAAVPALFSPGVERERAPRPKRRRAARLWRDGSVVLICPALVLAAELPLIRGAAGLLRLALPH